MKHRVLAGLLLSGLILVSAPLLAQEREPLSLTPSGEGGLELSALTSSGVWQLRVYTINRGHLDDFAQAWLEGVYPIRVSHGFKIPAAWLVRETNQFVWVIGYDGPEDWDAAQAAYYGSTERTGLAVDPLQWIARGESWFISAVSPPQ